jgi:hypothetical protein
LAWCAGRPCGLQFRLLVAAAGCVPLALQALDLAQSDQPQRYVGKIASAIKALDASAQLALGIGQIGDTRLVVEGLAEVIDEGVDLGDGLPLGIRILNALFRQEAKYFGLMSCQTCGSSA